MIRRQARRDALPINPAAPVTKTRMPLPADLTAMAKRPQDKPAARCTPLPIFVDSGQA